MCQMVSKSGTVATGAGMLRSTSEDILSKSRQGLKGASLASEYGLWSKIAGIEIPVLHLTFV